MARAIENPRGNDIQINISEGRFGAFNHQLQEIERQSFADIAAVDPRRALRLIIPLQLQTIDAVMTKGTTVELTSGYTDGTVETVVTDDPETARRILGKNALREMLSRSLRSEGENVIVTVKSESLKPRRKGRAPRKISRVQASFEVDKEEIQRYLAEPLPGEKEAAPLTPLIHMQVPPDMLVILDQIAQQNEEVDFRPLVQQNRAAAFNIILLVNVGEAMAQGKYTGMLNGVKKTVSRAAEGDKFPELAYTMIREKIKELMQEKGEMDVILEFESPNSPPETMKFVMPYDELR